MTPEGKVKAKVKKFLKQWDIWTDWPVPSGFGKSTLDCQIIAKGRSGWIETKAPGKDLTARQHVLATTFRRHACPVFVIDTADHLHPQYIAVAEWLEAIGAQRL